jgi:hypothetical protein
MPLKVVTLRIADRAEQDRIGLAGNRQRFRRQRMPARLVGRAADQRLDQRQPGQIQRLQYPHRFAGHFGADAVTGENRNLHGNRPPLPDPREPRAQDAARAHNIAAPIRKQVAFKPLAQRIEPGEFSGVIRPGGQVGFAIA